MNWNSVVQQSIDLRHWFHRHPELTWQETSTAERIRQQLTQWQIPWRSCAEHGTIAQFNTDADSEHIALRADMDALPISEKNSLDYCSTEAGKMHACGHDGHMAALLGFAPWLKQHQAQLEGPVSLLFQPAEEGGHGARKMIEDGALEGVDVIFGWHNWPALPQGKAVCPDGAVMSGNGTFHIHIQGQGGHASQPEAAHDPVLAAAAITLNLQQIISRRLPPQAAAVLSVTSIQAESNVTVIPDSVTLEGSIRVSNPRWRKPMNQLITEITHSTAQSYGVSANVEVRSRYEATINHPDAATRYRDALQSVLGDDYASSELLVPIMASEDFSYYLNEIPGAFALIGMAEQQAGGPAYQFPCHSPNYQFNDAILDSVMRVFCQLTGISKPPD